MSLVLTNTARKMLFFFFSGNQFNKGNFVTNFLLVWRWNNVENFNVENFFYKKKKKYYEATSEKNNVFIYFRDVVLLGI